MTGQSLAAGSLSQRTSEGDLCKRFSSPEIVTLAHSQGAWVAQPVERPTSAQVTISWFSSSSPVSGSVLTAEPGACFGFCVSLSLCPSHTHALSLSLSKINKHLKIIKKKKYKCFIRMLCPEMCLKSCSSYLSFIVDDWLYQHVFCK